MRGSPTPRSQPAPRPAEDIVPSAGASHASSMAQEAVDAGLQTLFTQYSQSSSQATTRVSTPNTSPKLTLTQFLRLCQDVGLTAPRGPMDPGLLQTIHSSYKPLGASALAYPQFLQAVEAVARSLQIPTEELSGFLTEHVQKRTTDSPESSSPARFIRSADERQRRLVNVYTSPLGGKGSISARSHAGEAGEPPGLGPSHQRFANVPRMWRPSMAAVEEKKAGSRGSPRSSAPSGRTAGSFLSSPPVSAIQEAWMEQGLGNFVSVGQSGLKPDPAFDEGDGMSPTQQISRPPAGSAAQKMPSWAMTLLDRVLKLEKQAQAANSAAAAAAHAAQLQPQQSWSSRRSSSGHEADPQDLSLVAAAEKSEARPASGLPRPPLPPVRAKSAEPLAAAAHASGAAAGDLNMEQRLLALESAGGTAALSLVKLRQQVQEQGEELARLAQTSSAVLNAGGAGTMDSFDTMGQLAQLRSSVQALLVSSAGHQKWQLQQQQLAATVATLSATMAGQQRPTAHGSVPPVPASPVGSATCKVSDASGHLSDDNIASLPGMAPSASAGRTSLPASPSASAGGTAATTGAADVLDARDLTARMQALETELEALLQRQRGTSQDSMMMVAASSAAAAATATASNTATETSKLEKRVRALEEGMQQVESKLLVDGAQVTRAASTQPEVSPSSLAQPLLDAMQVGSQPQELAAVVHELQQQQETQAPVAAAADATQPQAESRSGVAAAQQEEQKTLPQTQLETLAALDTQVRQMARTLQDLEQRLSHVANVAEAASIAAAPVSRSAPQQPVATAEEAMSEQQAANIQEYLTVARDQLHAVVERLESVELHQANQIQDQQSGLGARQDTHVQLAELWTKVDALSQQQLALAAAVDLPKLEQQVVALSERVQQELQEAARQRMEMTEVLSQRHLSRNPSQAMSVDPSDGSFMRGQQSDGSFFMAHASVRPEALLSLEQRIEELSVQIGALQRQHDVTAQFEHGLGELADRIVAMEGQHMTMQLTKVAEVEQQVAQLAADVQALTQQQQTLHVPKDGVLMATASTAGAASVPGATGNGDSAAAVDELQQQLQLLAAQLQAVESHQAQVLAQATQSAQMITHEQDAKVAETVAAVEQKLQAMQQGHAQVQQQVQALSLKVQQQPEASAAATAAVTAAMEPASASPTAEVAQLHEQVQRVHEAQRNHEVATAEKLMQVHDALLKEVQDLQAQLKAQEQHALLKLEQANALQSQAKQTAGADALQQTVAAAQLLSLQEGQKLNASSAGEALALAQGHAQQLQTVQAELGMLAQQLQGQMHMQQTLMTMMQQQQMQVQALHAAGVNPEVPHSVAASEPAVGTDSAGTHLTVEELSKKVKAFQTSQRAAVKMLVIEFQKLQDQVKQVAASGGAAVAGSATEAVGIATMAERLAALEQRMQAGQSEQGIGSSAELARALGILSIETQKSLAWIKEELQDVRSAASRAASAAPSRIVSRANSAGGSRPLSRSGSAKSPSRSPARGVSFAEQHADRGAALSAAATAALVQTAASRAGQLLHSTSDQQRDNLPQGPPLIEPSNGTRDPNSLSTPEELKRALGLLSLETQRELAELRAEVKGIASRAASAAPSRVASRRISHMSSWEDPADEEDLMTGPTPALTPMAGASHSHAFAPAAPATVTDQALVAQAQASYVSLPLPGAAGPTAAAPQLTQLVSAAAQLQAMQVKQLGERLQQMESALPPQSALGELVAKVEDMAQALMMVADKLNKRLNKVEKMMGKGSISGGIVPAIVALQEKTAEAEAELKAYLDIITSTMEQRVDTMYLTLGVVPPPPGARPWNDARSLGAAQQLPQSDVDDDSNRTSRADLSAVPSRTALRGSRAPTDTDGDADADQGTPNGRGARRVVINHAASEVRTIPIVKKAFFAQLTPEGEEAVEAEPVAESPTPHPESTPPAPGPHTQHHAAAVQQRRAPLTSLVQLPQPHLAGSIPQMQQMQHAQQMYMQAMAAIQVQQQQQPPQAASAPPMLGMEPSGLLTAHPLWNMPGLPLAVPDPAAGASLMTQSSLTAVAAAGQPQQLGLGGGAAGLVPNARSSPLMPLYADEIAATRGSPVPGSAALVSQGSRSQWEDLTSTIAQQAMAGAGSQLPAAALGMPQASNTVAKRPSLKQCLSASGRLRLSAGPEQVRPGTSPSPSPPTPSPQTSAPQVQVAPVLTGTNSSRSFRFVADEEQARASAPPAASAVPSTIKLLQQPERRTSVQARLAGGSDTGGRAEELAVLSRAQSQTLEHEGREIVFEVAEESYF